jgi:hypothetical protein
MRPGSIVRSRFAALAALLFVTVGCGARGCGDAPGPSSSARREPRVAAPGDLTPNERAWGVAPVRSPAVTYQPDVVMVEGGPDVVRGLAADGLTWTIDASAPNAGEIVPGKIVFLTSRVVGRVLGVTKQQGTLGVVLGPVEITDVIREGTFAVDQPIDLSKVLTYTQQDPPGAFTPTEPLARFDDSASPGPRAMLASYPAGWRGALPEGGIVSAPAVVYGTHDGAYQTVQAAQEVNIHQFRCFPVIGSDGIGVHLSTDAGGVRMSGDVRLRLSNPRLRFNLDIKGGKVRTALVRLEGAAGLLMKFEAGSEKHFKANVNERIVLPVDFSLPIIGMPVPFAVTVRQQFIIKTAFSGTTGLSATGEYSFGGSFSAGYDNGKFDVGGPVGFKAKQSLLESLGGVSLAPIGLVLMHQTRVIVGIGAFGFATGPFFGFNATVGVTQTGAASAMLLNCKQATLNVGLVAGIGYSIPKPVTDAINFFLRQLNLGQIKGYGGLEASPITIINSTGTMPPTKACGG